MLLKGPKLTPAQWKILAYACCNISQAIILFGLAALFVPKAVNLESDFPRFIALIYLSWGLLLLVISVTISKKVK